jgi:two-component sensor histidine kinase
MLNIHPMVQSRSRDDLAAIDPIPQSQLKEEQLQFVVHELGHRIKNLLAVVQALANQTAQRSATVKEFQTVFSERLQGLSRSLDLLVEGEGRGASIADLVRSQLGPFGEIDGMHIAATGPVVSLNPEATQNIGLALHELATNATKHGALSVPSGAVTVDWEITPSELGPSRFRLNWHEHHGPRVISPQRRGFGHVVLQRMTGRALQGKVSHEFGAGGVSWTLDVPAVAVVMQSRSELPITVVPEVSSAMVARGHVSVWRRHLPGLREGVARQNPETDRYAKVRPVHVLMSLPEGHACTLGA